MYRPVLADSLACENVDTYFASVVSAVGEVVNVTSRLEHKLRR